MAFTGILVIFAEINDENWKNDKVYFGRVGNSVFMLGHLGGIPARIAYDSLSAASFCTVPSQLGQTLQLADEPPEARNLYQELHGVQVHTSEGKGGFNKYGMDHFALLCNLCSRTLDLKGDVPCHSCSSHHPYSLV